MENFLPDNNSQDETQAESQFQAEQQQDQQQNQEMKDELNVFLNEPPRGFEDNQYQEGQEFPEQNQEQNPYNNENMEDSQEPVVGCFDPNSQDAFQNQMEFFNQNYNQEEDDIQAEENGDEIFNKMYQEDQDQDEQKEETNDNVNERQMLINQLKGLPEIPDFKSKKLKKVQKTLSDVDQNEIQKQQQQEYQLMQELQEQELENLSEDEGIEDYKIGGYHPVYIGEVIIDRYVIIEKVGWGHFSTVWLAKDFKYNTYVAIKIQKSAPHYLEAAYDEVEILQTVARNAMKPEWIKCLKEYYKADKREHFTRDDCHVVQLINSFIYRSPYGNHFCMAFEIMGVNLLSIIKRYDYKGVPMNIIRLMAKQILIGLDFLHRMCNLIHTDLKPENILICLTPEEIKKITEEGHLSSKQEFYKSVKQIRKKFNINVKKKNESKVFAACVVKEQKENARKAEEEAKEENKKENPLKNQAQHQVSLIDSVIFLENGTYRFPDNWNKKQKKKTNKKIKKMRKQGHVFPVTDLNDIKEKEEEQQRVKEVKKENPTAKKQKVEKPKATGKDGKFLLDENVKLKIVDLGNGCWTHHHFSTEIQTRQYRSPEVIIGAHYDTSADVWSFACTIFEMLTGDFLFEPRNGPKFSKDDDHLAQIQELTQKFSTKFCWQGLKSKKFFSTNGSLKNIETLHQWSLQKVLLEKYHFKKSEVSGFANFLLPMLNYYPFKRATAREMLFSKWFTMLWDKNTRISEQQIMQLLEQKKREQAENIIDVLEHIPFDIESDDNFADNEDNDDFSLDEENLNDLTSEDNENNTSVIEIFDNSFNKEGGYVSHGNGITTGALDIPPWQFENQ